MNDHYKSSNIAGGGGAARGHLSNTSGSNRYHHSNSNIDKRHSSTAAKGKTEWRKTAIRICGDWSEQLSSKNKIYYYNCTTEVSQWQKPDEWTLPDVPKQDLIDQYHKRERLHDKESHSVKRPHPAVNSGSNHQHPSTDSQYSSRSNIASNVGGSLNKIPQQQRHPPVVNSSYRPSSSGGVSPKRLRYDSSGSGDTGSNHQYGGVSSNNHNYSNQSGGVRLPKTLPHSLGSTSNSVSTTYNQHSNSNMVPSNSMGSASSRIRESGNYRPSSNNLAHLHNPNSLGSMLAAKASSLQKSANPYSGTSSSHLPSSNNPILEDMDISPGSSPLSGGSCSPPQPLQSTNLQQQSQNRKRSPIDQKHSGVQHRIPSIHEASTTSSSGGGHAAFSSSVNRHQAASSSLPVRQLIDTLSDSLTRNQSNNTMNLVHNSSTTARQHPSTTSSTNPSASSLLNNVAQQLLYSRQLSTATSTSTSSSHHNQTHYSRSLSATQTSQCSGGSGQSNNNAIITSLINSLSNNNTQSHHQPHGHINNKPDPALTQTHSSNTNRHLEDLVSRLENQLSRDQHPSQSLHINTTTSSTESNAGFPHHHTISPASNYPRHTQHSNHVNLRHPSLVDKKVIGSHFPSLPRSGSGSNDQNSELIRLLTDILKNPSILQQPGRECSYKSIIALLQKYLEDLKSRQVAPSSPSVSAAIQKVGVNPSLINKIPHSNGCHLGVTSGESRDSQSNTKPHSFPSTTNPADSGTVISHSANLSRGNSHDSNSSCLTAPPTSSPYSSNNQNLSHQQSTPSILDSVGIMQYLDTMPLSRFKDPAAERLEQEAQMEAQKFDKLQTVLYGELSGELKKLRALVRIGEAKTAVQQKKKEMLEELMESIESRKPLPPSFSSTFKAT